VRLPASSGQLRSQRIGVMLARIDLGAAKAAARVQVRNAALSVFGLLCLVALLLWGMSYLALTRRMRRILAAADALAAGKLDRRTGVRGRDELGRIGERFDAMAEKLEQGTMELQKLQRAVEHMHESLIITDAEGTILYANPAFERITGYAIEEAVGRNPRMLKSGKHRPEFYEAFWKRISSGKPWNGRMIDRRKNGELYTARVSVAPVLDGQGVIRYYVGVQEDITEQQRLEEKLFEGQKMESLGVLVGGIAHDFNNMLAGMLGNLHLARMKVRDDPALLKIIERVDKLGYQAADMIKQLLAFARQDPVEFKVVEMAGFVREAARLARVSVPESIRVDIEVPEEPMHILGDTTQIQQMLMNLVNNARDALDRTQAPRIRIRLERVTADADFIRRHQIEGGDYACLSVRDNGEGIPEDRIEKIFEPFYTSKPVGEGTGLGLAMIYGAMQRHGGVIEVDSRPGEGACFRLYFPISKAADVAEETAREIVRAAGERLLLVDDEEVIRDTVAEVLEDVGYRVDVADNGASAVAMFAEHADEYRAVITDVVMPEMGGVEAARRMREIREDIPVVFVTGYDREHVLAEIGDMQRAVALSKPVHPAILQEMLARIL